MMDRSGESTYEYDGLGRITKVTTGSGQVTFDSDRPTVKGDGSTVEFMGYDISKYDGKSSVNITNKYKLVEIIVYDNVYNYK